MPRAGSTPYSALKGDQFNEEWNDVLYHNSARANHFVHCMGVAWTAQRRNILRY
jgi:hypothetical protein